MPAGRQIFFSTYLWYGVPVASATTRARTYEFMLLYSNCVPGSHSCCVLLTMGVIGRPLAAAADLRRGLRMDTPLQPGSPSSGTYLVTGSSMDRMWPSFTAMPIAAEVNDLAMDHDWNRVVRLASV